MCRGSLASVTSVGLRLTMCPAGTFGDDLRCIVPRTVLVRVRATFREPVAEEPNKAGGFITASGRIITGQIAVRTLGGRQIAYADVTDSGRARMFSRGCL